MPKKPKWNEVPCPFCKEPIAVSAQKCPHCQTQFSADDMVKRRKDHNIVMGSGCLILLIATGLLTWCSSPSKDTDKPSTEATVASSDSAVVASATPEELKVAREAAEGAQKASSLPRYAPEPPITASCATIECEADKVWFRMTYWPKAWKGDYQAQRNAAFCRSNGCSGAVQIDQVEACAWRLVINDMNAAKADAGDVSNMHTDCSKLDDGSRRLAADKATAFIAKIKG